MEGRRLRHLARGEATLGYKLAQHRRLDIPLPPRVTEPCSTRSWKGRVRVWRRQLHAYDPQTDDEWREARKLFPLETLFLVHQLSARQDVDNRKLPPVDLMKEARLYFEDDDA